MESDTTDQGLEYLRRHLGTPHRPNRARPGNGIDCIRLVIGAHQATGTIPPFRWPQYSQTTGIGAANNRMTAILLNALWCREIEPDRWEPQDGDIGIFKPGSTSNHAGIAWSGRFWHVTARRPVHHCHPLTIRGKLQTIIRIDRPGFRNQPDVFP